MDGPVACLALINTARLDRKQKRPKQFVAASAFVFILAATYVPTQLPVQYHRPCGA